MTYSYPAERAGLAYAIVYILRHAGPESVLIGDVVRHAVGPTSSYRIVESVVTRGEPVSKPPVPPELDRIADVVLKYKPKPKSKAAKRRARKIKRAESQR